MKREIGFPKGGGNKAPLAKNNDVLSRVLTLPDLSVADTRRTFDVALLTPLLGCW